MSVSFDLSRINCVAILTPAPGKKERTQQLLSEVLVANVEKNEPDTLLYQFWWIEDRNEFLFIESYKTIENLTAHMQTSYFKQCIEAIETENLLAKPMELKLLKEPIAGFNRS
ncbi:hypothetical protein BJX66DRAFT_313018 [Aspergillus keveii]|uniref:ABM domain-containing protein n=1 Tax=Aspergillus keveii TaxID=714993 RepID=A0ABR4FSQ5_9EURO